MNSAHVVRTLDYGATPDGIPFIVLELLEGESLDALLARHGRLSFAETAVVVTHMCRALAAAHALGIVHRDVKPANVFRSASSEGASYKLLDFGVAKYRPRGRTRAGADELSGLTFVGDLLGTPAYMSPEQIAGEGEATYQADLGDRRLAYQCLTGRLPFDGESLEALSTAVLVGELVPPSEVLPELGPATDAWFAVALSREPEARPPTRIDLAASFEELAGSAAGTTATSRPPRPTPPPSLTPPSRGTAILGPSRPPLLSRSSPASPGSRAGRLRLRPLRRDKHWSHRDRARQRRPPRARYRPPRPRPRTVSRARTSLRLRRTSRGRRQRARAGGLRIPPAGGASRGADAARRSLGPPQAELGF